MCPSVSASLAEHRVFKVHPHCSLCQCFSPFHGCIIFHCVDFLLLHPSFYGRLSSFVLLALVNSTAMNMVYTF